MADNYQLILIGKIAAGYDVEIVHEKLSIIFDIDLKKIPKLLKKPTIIRKGLNYKIAFQYKQNLEKIGVLCDFLPKLETEFEPIAPTATIEDQETFTLVELEETEVAISDNSKFRVIDIKMTFGAILIFIIKLLLASIPALLIFWVIIHAVQILMYMLF
ncbi:MAG: hypothetical protein KAH84_13010 [Thiomargarita sp.]|nr:hypothetical protein [Thiomargarita sp.]